MMIPSVLCINKNSLLYQIRTNLVVASASLSPMGMFMHRQQYRSYQPRLLNCFNGIYLISYEKIKSCNHALLDVVGRGKGYKIIPKNYCTTTTSLFPMHEMLNIAQRTIIHNQFTRFRNIS